MLWKPTSRECELLRRAASRESCPSASFNMVLLEPCIRSGPKFEYANSIPHGEFNIALVSDDPDWADTDLYDYGTWATFRRGVALTEDGRAILDFALRRKFDEDQELLGNITVYYEDGRITRIHGYPGEYPIK